MHCKSAICKREMVYTLSLCPLSRSVFVFQISSQNPYIAEFIGEPYSYLVDPRDEQNIEKVVKKLLKNPLVSSMKYYSLSLPIPTPSLSSDSDI